MYKTGRYSSSDHSYLYKHDETFITFRIEPYFEELILKSKDGYSISFKKEECERGSLQFKNISRPSLFTEEIRLVMNLIVQEIDKKYSQEQLSRRREI